ncbi:hypothetical protein HWB91_gp74 [Bacillus phage vB_BboS-125]|uniref:HK97 gp10 family phage protein n=1 Tax=Bacillus phage vB_BboS-125 TaxID=2419618 RepID=A0A3G3BW10_9CAUD|nr:hypothetical protein HWB91_gp74 [Bacillus phage vB_BboS-125]AYP68444.1 hypothetical protein BboS125_00075 [Bacillus phage vB_BboS-125]
MGKVVRITTRGLEEWQKALLKMQHEGVDQMKDRILRTTGLRIQEYLDDLTPARSGRLKGSMSAGHPDNVFKIQVGRTSYVFVGTSVEYAAAVNDGHTQRAGRFVPGFWSSGTFHYQPGAREGMVLTGKVIPGAFMFEKAQEYTEEDIPTIMEFETRRTFEEIFGG